MPAHFIPAVLSHFTCLEASCKHLCLPSSNNHTNKNHSLTPHPSLQFQSKGYNYGFVEYDDPGAAERAMQTLNGRRVHQQEIRVNWAYQSNTVTKEDTSNHFHIFVGDLSNEVNDEVLLQAFSAFGTVSEARVMWDMKTGRSRGYGFVAFRERSDAEKALSNMDGEWLGSRAIRCNWANQKGQPSYSQQQAMSQMGLTPTTPFGHHSFPTQGANSYEMVVQQTPAWQTTCYVGNLTPYTTQNDLVPLFQNFGYVTETRFQSDRGFAFVKMDTHENAANAICQLNGYQVNGRPLKCSVSQSRAPIKLCHVTNTPHSGARTARRLALALTSLLVSLSPLVASSPVTRRARPLSSRSMGRDRTRCLLSRVSITLQYHAQDHTLKLSQQPLPLANSATSLLPVPGTDPPRPAFSPASVASAWHRRARVASLARSPPAVSWGRLLRARRPSVAASAAATRARIPTITPTTFTANHLPSTGPLRNPNAVTSRLERAA